MKQNQFSILILSSLFLSTSALSQVNNNSTTSTGNQSGNVGAAPLSLDIDVEAIQTIGKWIGTRAHTLNLDTQMLEMKQNGSTQRKCLAGFSAEGALIYNYELNGEELEYWNDTGRNAGLQILPYSVQFMPNGVKKVSFSAAGLRNMNALSNSREVEEVFKIIDRLDFLTFTWDEHLSFKNLRTFDFTIANANLKLGLVKSEDNNNYLALRAGGNVGGVQTHFDGGLESDGYANVKEMGWKSEYTGGLELNLQSKKNARLNLQSNFVGGVNGVPVRNISVSNYNGQQTEKNKLDEGQLPYRHYRYLKNSLDASISLKKSVHPVRMGVGVDVNFELSNSLIHKDAIKGDAPNFGSATRIDLQGNYTQGIRGRLYLNF